MSHAALSQVTPQPVDERPMVALLRAAADEMFSLSEIGQPLHALIERQMGGYDLQEKSIEDAQLIDFLVQHLQATGTFLRQLAEQTSEDAMIDFDRVRTKVPLADLARRLGGEAPSEGPPGGSGDLDLF
jgi:hypothetical protein